VWEAEKTLEGSSKLVVEDGVDDWVEETVDVAEPDEEREQDRVKPADARQLEQIVADARGIDDVQCKERDPAEQEHACISNRHILILVRIISHHRHLFYCLLHFSSRQHMT